MPSRHAAAFPIGGIFSAGIFLGAFSAWVRLPWLSLLLGRAKAPVTGALPPSRASVVGTLFSHVQRAMVLWTARRWPFVPAEPLPSCPSPLVPFGGLPFASLRVAHPIDDERGTFRRARAARPSSSGWLLPRSEDAPFLQLSHLYLQPSSCRVGADLHCQGRLGHPRPEPHQVTRYRTSTPC